MANPQKQEMQIERFGALAPHIDREFKRATDILNGVKELIGDRQLRLSALTVTSEGDGWLILTIFGREVLFRAEVTWGTGQTTLKVAAYLNDSEFPNQYPGRIWKPLDVVAEPTGGYVDYKGERVIPHWYLVDAVLEALHSRQVVFRRGPELESPATSQAG